MIRVLYLGQKWIGERCFELLIRHPRIEVCAAVTNPTPSRWWRTNAVWNRAQVLGIPVVSNEERNEEALGELVAVHRPAAILSVQHPWILPASLLEAVEGAFNLHSARLPDYGGHNAVNHVLLNGEDTHTVTAHWMAASVDSGDVVFEETIRVEPTDTARRLYERALPAGETAFGRLLDAISAGIDTVPRRPLHGPVRFYPRSSIDSEREIVSLADARDVELRSRALYFPPFEPAFHVIDGRRHYVLPAGFAEFASEMAGASW